MAKQIRLVATDFERAFGSPLSRRVKQRLEQKRIVLEPLSITERDHVIQQIINTLLDPSIIPAGKHRRSQWETGWRENLILYQETNSLTTILPRYFGKYPYVRFEGEFFRTAHDNTEYLMLEVLLDWLFDKYLANKPVVYEFGCGTGHNLLRLREINLDAELWGLDWAESSQKILSEYVSKGMITKLNANKFDYFEPDYNFNLAPESALFTVASLEQIGNQYVPFVDYVLQKKPSLCLHIEPMAELLDSNRLPDFLSIAYFSKRNYLSGYVEYLKKLESEDKLEILLAQRSNIGSMFVDGYSIVVWRPLQ